MLFVFLLLARFMPLAWTSKSVMTVFTFSLFGFMTMDRKKMVRSLLACIMKDVKKELKIVLSFFLLNCSAKIYIKKNNYSKEINPHYAIVKRKTMS